MFGDNSISLNDLTLLKGEPIFTIGINGGLVFKSKDKKQAEQVYIAMMKAYDCLLYTSPSPRDRG